jgi:hypothetical protein
MPVSPLSLRIKNTTGAHAFEQAQRVVIGFPTVAG